MILINFLYYIVYRVFKLIPRRESIDHLLASSFLAGLLMTNIVTVLSLLNFFRFLRETLNVEKFHFLIILVFAVCYFFNRRYFITSGNYDHIINECDDKYGASNKLMIILGILYIVGSFFGFWALGFYFKKN